MKSNEGDILDVLDKMPGYTRGLTTAYGDGVRAIFTRTCSGKMFEITIRPLEQRI